MNNLMSSTQIGTIFLDFDLCIQRFTPTMTKVINLIQTDIGRPVSHIVSNLHYDHLVEDVQSVLDTLIPQEREVETTGGSWYLMRIMPYRTIENVIDGVVITFVDITGQKMAQTALQQSEGKYRSLVKNSPDTITIVDRDDLIQFINRTPPNIKIEDVMGKMTLTDLQPPAPADTYQKILAQLFETGTPTTLETTRIGPNNTLTWYETRIAPIREGEQIMAAMLITTDITERKESAELRRLAVVVRDSNDAITVQDLAGRILAWNPSAERLYGWNEVEALAMNIRELVPKDERKNALHLIKKLAKDEVIEPFRTQRVCKNGRILEIWFTATKLIDQNGKPYAIATTERDVTEQGTVSSKQ